MQPDEIEEIEIDLLLEAVERRYGYDFRTYARETIGRRVRNLLQRSDHRYVSQLMSQALRDRDLFERIVREFSITVTSMFRDPEVYAALREQVIPLPRSHPFIRIWHAGCATGEEVYSMAILLKEAGLSERVTIFATDFNDEALRVAATGVYGLEKAREFTENYQLMGGKGAFSDYYRARYGAFALDSRLRDNITFANHNLVTDEVFSEMHLVLCRNVLIYFNSDLQSRVTRLICRSLVNGGFLCLGNREFLHADVAGTDFKEVDAQRRIFQKNYRLEEEPGALTV